MIMLHLSDIRILIDQCDQASHWGGTGGLPGGEYDGGGDSDGGGRGGGV